MEKIIPKHRVHLNFVSRISEGARRAAGPLVKHFYELLDLELQKGAMRLKVISWDALSFSSLHKCRKESESGPAIVSRKSSRNRENSQRKKQPKSSARQKWSVQRVRIRAQPVSTSPKAETKLNHT